MALKSFSCATKEQEDIRFKGHLSQNQLSKAPRLNRCDGDGVITKDAL